MGHAHLHSIAITSSFQSKLVSEREKERSSATTNSNLISRSNIQMTGQKQEQIGKRGRAAVVVLGDIGRSPRMQYHALSLARQASLEVDVVAYGGSDPHLAVSKNPSIHIHKMRQWPRIPQGIPKIIYPFMLLLKPLVQFIMLLWFLCIKIPSPDVFIVQNPPSVPTLVAVKWASWLKRSAFIIDWHNFGYTLLGLSLGRNSRFVAVYRWVEKRYGKVANGSLCVTRAMQHELAQNWGIKATVLYDQPPEFFHPTSLEEKHKLFCRLHDYLSQPHGVWDCISTEVEQSILEDLQNRVQLSSVALPSVSFYTFINTHNGLNYSAISHDGSMVAGGFSDSSVKVWDMAKLGQQSGSTVLQGENDYTPSEHMPGPTAGKRSYTLFQGHSGPVYSATFSPLGDFILSSSADATIRLWSIKLNANLVCYKGHNYPNGMFSLVLSDTTLPAPHMIGRQKFGLWTVYSL